MTRAELYATLDAMQHELHRLALDVEEALRPIQAELLLGRITRLESQMEDLIEALPTLDQEENDDDD